MSTVLAWTCSTYIAIYFTKMIKLLSLAAMAYFICYGTACFYENSAS